MEHVIVERSFDEPLEVDPIDLAKKGASCMEMHNMRYLRAYLSSDKKRMICVFEAPDAESVRIANRQLKMPFERVWTATVHEPA